MDNFNKAPPEKQKAMLNAGFGCFGRDGYQKTAMSEIASEAGVSKALLFHYFGTKKELYFFLFRYACDEMIKEFTEGNDDFFDCIRLGTQIKLRVMAKHPGMYDFLLSVIKEKDSKIIEDLKQINLEEASRAMGRLFVNVDWSRFRPEYDRASVMELLSWISDGCARKYSETKSGDEIAEILGYYMKIMKRALYKEEYI